MLGKGNLERVTHIKNRLQRPVQDNVPKVPKFVKERRRVKDKKRTQSRNSDRDRKYAQFDLHAGIDTSIFDVSSSRIEDLFLLVTGVCSTSSDGDSC